jgi:PTH1 family peptidyl-tRNA hydrolase
MENTKKLLRAIIGLGNPGKHHYHNRHNIGFRIIDALATRHGAHWTKKDSMEITEIMVGERKILLIKPQTFMNASGTVIPFLGKQGIKPDQILVIHDELEMPFGKIKLRVGGSARGHKGLRSIIDICGKDFYRLSFGIGRPDEREDVAQYVLSNFSEDQAELGQYIDQAVNLIESAITT